MAAISGLQPHPRNYNRHGEEQVADLARSLERFGQRKPITTWRGLTITGHGVVEAAKRLGWTEVWAAPCPDEWTEEEALAWLAADNELARGADPDEAQLAALVAELGDVDAELARLAAGGEERLRELLDAITEPDGDDWDDAFSGLPTTDRSPFQQMTFTLHDEQVDKVKRALILAGKLGDFSDSQNQNSNGNALAFLAETFITEHGDGQG